MIAAIVVLVAIVLWPILAALSAILDNAEIARRSNARRALLRQPATRGELAEVDLGVAQLREQVERLERLVRSIR